MDTNKLLAVVIAFVTGGYLLPFAISVWREQADSMKVLLVNFFLGWTIIGWVIALIWSIR